VEPPQSVSVSSWLSTVSEQLAAWQMALSQTRLVQSLGELQPEPLAQAAHVPPPQSTPVSS
jgi:hypothetical protein